MRRAVALFALLGLVLTACGGGAGSEQASTTAGVEDVTTTSTAAPETTADSGSTDTTSGADATTTTDSGRPAAPDFTLELGEGGSYTLSEGTKPVFMVFWAEW